MTARVQTYETVLSPDVTNTIGFAKFSSRRSVPINIWPVVTKLCPMASGNTATKSTWPFSIAFLRLSPSSKGSSLFPFNTLVLSCPYSVLTSAGFRPVLITLTALVLE